MRINKRTKISTAQRNGMHALGVGDNRIPQAELAELFGVGRSTIYRTIDRMRPKPVEPERPFAHMGVPGSRHT